MPQQPHPHVQRIQEGSPFWTRPTSTSRQSLYRIIRRQLQPVRTTYRQFCHRFTTRSRYLTCRSTQSLNLFVIAEARSGSNLLIDYLRSIPGVVAAEEVLNHKSSIGLRRRCISKAASLRHIKYSMAMGGDISVCKLAPHHLKWHHLSVRDIAHAFRNAKFLVLYRHSLIEQYVSACRLRITGEERYRRHGERFQQTILIDPDHVIEYCRRTRSAYQQVTNDTCTNVSMVSLSYEDLADHPQQVFDELICPFLGVDRVEVKTRMKKQNNLKLEDSIANYEDVANLLVDGDARLVVQVPNSRTFQQRIG